MKKIFSILLLSLILLGLQSCSPKIVERTSYTSALPFLVEKFKGKSKEYIINNYKYNITDIKHLDDQYEILVFRRYPNYIVGERYTYFHMKNGYCYSIETNEYMATTRKVEVGFWDRLFNSY